MGSKRKRRRRLKKKIKMFLLSIPIIAAFVALVIFGFQIKSVTLSSDLGQYKDSEVLEYLEHESIDNSLVLWARSLLGIEPKLDMFEDYSVSLKSPSKIKITAYEKKLKGFIKEDKTYYYIDENGIVLKVTSEKLKNVPKITGLAYKKIIKYNIIEPQKEECLSVLLKVINCTEPYNYDIKRYKITEEAEATVYIKNIQVQFGKESQMEDKVLAFNDLHDNVIKYRGVLNMKRLNETGTYTLKKTKKSKKKK